MPFRYRPGHKTLPRVGPNLYVVTVHLPQAQSVRSLAKLAALHANAGRAHHPACCEGAFPIIMFLVRSRVAQMTIACLDGPLAASIALRVVASGLAWMSLSVAIAGCGDAEVKRAQAASKDLARSLGAEDSTQQNVASSLPPGASRVILYIDASRSMAGFGGCGSSPSEFDVALDRLSVDWGITSLTKFGESQYGAPRFDELPFTRGVHCPAFYAERQNPDYKLYAHIAGDSTGAVHAYVTDAVQSDLVAGSQSPSVRSLQEWLQSGKALRIVALRSRFQGPAWSEQRQRWVGTASVDNRPFYIFLFGQTDAQLDQVLSRLSRSVLQQTVVLSFSPDMARCRVVTQPVSRRDELLTPAWILLELPRLPGLASNPTGVASYECLLDARAPLESVLPSVNIRYRRWDGQGFARSAELPAGTRVTADSVVVNVSSSRAIVALQAPRDHSTRFGFYELQLSGAPGDLKPQVSALSTDDDTTLDTFDRTYRFSWLIEQLVRSQLHGTIPPRHFFTTIMFN